MTKKDFKIIAEIIQNLDIKEFYRRQVAMDFADKLKEKNSKFREDIFFEACGVDPW